MKRIMIQQFNSKIYLLLSLIAMLVVGGSCKDSVFDVPVGERITPEQHYESIIDLEVSMYGALIPLQNVMPNLIVVDGLRSDLMDVTPNADGYLQDLNMQVLSPENPYLDPSDLYKVIINVNEILVHIEEVTQKDRNFEDYMLFDYTGFLIALRSWTYLTLVRTYGEVAWIADNLTELPENMYQKTMQKEELLDTLINQLQPWIYDAGTGVSRTESYLQGFMNARAVLGELYLEKNDYVNAADYFKKALESYPQFGNIAFKVEKTYQTEAWKSIFIGAENALIETMSVIPFSMTQGQVNPLAQWMLPADQYLVKPSQLLIDSMEMQIQNNGNIGDIYRGMGITYDTTSTGEPYIKKYALDESEPLSSDIIISRAADIHLMMAEALNRAGDPKTALIFLNAGINGEPSSQRPAGYAKFSTNLGVRGRVLLSSRVVSDTIPLEEQIEKVEDLIIWEKAMECAYEGKRMSDLIRVALRRDNPEEYLSNAVSAKFTDEAKAAQVKSMLMNRANWYVPVK